MCECYRVGGRFIAEDPNCPIHGTEAQRRVQMEGEELARRDRLLDALYADVKSASSVEELRLCVLQLIDTMRGE